MYLEPIIDQHRKVRAADHHHLRKHIFRHRHNITNHGGLPNMKSPSNSAKIFVKSGFPFPQ
jgi:hypothetical protein